MDQELGDDAGRLLSEIQSLGGRGIAVEADVSDIRGLDRLVDRASEAFGGLDILVNNASVQVREPFVDASEASWDLVMRVNLKAPYFLSRAAVRAMRARGGGVILNIGSLHDTVPLRDFSTYAIAKAGLDMLTKSLALELADLGIRVNAIAPGVVRTDRNPHLQDPATCSRVAMDVPLGRVAQPSDIPAAAVFLASPEAAYVTGAVLHVDGGLRLR